MIIIFRGEKMFFLKTPKAIVRMLIRCLNNQQQILENQQVLLGEVRKQYQFVVTEANKRYCEKLEAKIAESAESSRLTSETLMPTWTPPGWHLFSFPRSIF